MPAASTEMRRRGEAWRLASRRLALLRMLGSASSGLVAASVATTLVAGLLPVGLILSGGLLSQRIVESLARGDDDFSSVTPAFLLVMGLFLLGQLLSPVQGRLRWLVTKSVDGAIRERVVRAAMSGADLTHLQGAEHGDAMGQLHGLVRWSATPGAGAAGILGLARDYLTAFAAAAVLAWYQPVVAAAMLGVTLVMRVRWRRAVLGIIAKWREGDQPRREGWYLSDLGLGKPAQYEVRLFGLRSWLVARLTRAEIAAWTPTWNERRAGMGRNGALHLLLIGTATLVALVWAAGATAARELDVAELVVFVPMLFTVLMVGNSSGDDMAVEYGLNVLPAIETIERDAARARPGDRGREVDADPSPTIELRGVCFGYPGGDQVLHDVTLLVPGGSSLALVGLNGAGKTTLVRLLCGLYPPTSGSVRVNGVDLREISLTSWHRLVAPMLQGFLRVPGDVRDNVAVGSVEHAEGDSAIGHSLREAGAASFADRLPDGLATALATPHREGTDLSGGQWQRLALARALHSLRHGARLLVLDEPTSNLDTASEQRLVERLVEQTAGTATTVLVTHRLALARRCDRIVVLSDGRVAEYGTHHELVKRGGRYADAFGMQAAMYPIEADSV